MNQRGFTLIETIIYIFIISMVLITVAGFLLNIIQTKQKTRAASEVIAAARIMQDRLTDAARHAEGINTGASTFGLDPGVLSFDMVAAGVDPTIFSLTADDGQFQVSEAGGDDTVLTSDNVQITSLLFTNLTSSEDTGIIQVQFSVQAVDNNANIQYDYSQSFQTTLRIPLD